MLAGTNPNILNGTNATQSQNILAEEYKPRTKKKLVYAYFFVNLFPTNIIITTEQHDIQSIASKD